MRGNLPFFNTPTPRVGTLGVTAEGYAVHGCALEEEIGVIPFRTPAALYCTSLCFSTPAAALETVRKKTTPQRRSYSFLRLSVFVQLRRGPALTPQNRPNDVSFLSVAWLA